MYCCRGYSHAVRAFISLNWQYYYVARRCHLSVDTRVKGSADSRYNSSVDSQYNGSVNRLAPGLMHMQVQARSKQADLETVVSNLSAGFKPVDTAPVSSSGFAAVLVPLFEDSTGTVRVLLTERSSQLQTHAGEVAFPGGKRDPEDADDIATALREAHEETGLRPSDVKVVACSRPFLSRHMLSVAPVIATIPPDFQPVPNPGEVESVFSMPLERVLSAEGHRHKDTQWQGCEYRLHFFDYEGYSVWGLTAAILINIAKVAFQTSPEYEENAPHQLGGRLEYDGKQLVLRGAVSESEGDTVPDIEGAATQFIGSVEM